MASPTEEVCTWVFLYCWNKRWMFGFAVVLERTVWSFERSLFISIVLITQVTAGRADYVYRLVLATQIKLISNMVKANILSGDVWNSWSMLKQL